MIALRGSARHILSKRRVPCSIARAYVHTYDLDRFAITVEAPAQPPTLNSSSFRSRTNLDRYVESEQKERFELPAAKVPELVASPALNVESPKLPNDREVPLRNEESNVAAAHLPRVSQALEPSVIEMLPPTLRKFTLRDKVAIVTGGARGLGLNMAQALSESGVKAIALFDIQTVLGLEAAAEIHRATGILVQYFDVNVCDDASVMQAVEEVMSEFGSVDILINSAGVAFSNIKAEKYDTNDFCRTMDINANGSFRLAKACGRQMIKNGKGGSIIFIASMSASIVNYPQEQCAYNASKAAVMHLTKSLAAEWAKHDIRVNSISPGYMDTALNRVPTLDAQKKIWKSMTPQGRLGSVDELNNLAVFLASDASTFMTGSNVVIDGGYSVY